MVCAYSNGKKHPGYYMPDMLVLSHGGLKVLEVKALRKKYKNYSNFGLGVTPHLPSCSSSYCACSKEIRHAE